MNRSSSLKRMFLPVIFLSFLAGCSMVTVESQRYLGVPTYAPTNPAQVEILRTEPTRPHVRLGEISLEPQDHPPVAEIEDKLRTAAAKMGANAAVIVADKTQIIGAWVTGPWWARQADPIYGRVIIAVAIRYTP